MGLGPSLSCNYFAYSKLLLHQQQDDCVQLHKHGRGSHEYELFKLYDLPFHASLVLGSSARIHYRDFRFYTGAHHLYDLCGLHNLTNYDLPRH
jgi:hypothetical protein